MLKFWMCCNIHATILWSLNGFLLPHLVTLHGKWHLFLYSRAWKVILHAGTKAGLLIFWCLQLFSIATSEIPADLWLCEGIEVGSCSSAGNTDSNPVTRRDCPINCAVTFLSLLGSPSAFQWHPCLILLRLALSYSVYLLWLLGDKLIMNTWNMGVW